MLASKSLFSRAIVSLEEGQRIGSVRGLVIDPKTLEVVALQVDQKGLFREHTIMPFAKVHSIGDDAITIDRSSHVERHTNLPGLLNLIKQKVGLVGSKVITNRGSKVGIVDEFYVDPATGKILSLELKGAFGDGLLYSKAMLPVSAIRTVSGEMIIIFEDKLEELELIESAVSETVKRLGETSSRLWDNASSKTQEWSKLFMEKTRTLWPPKDSTKFKDQMPPAFFDVKDASAKPVESEQSSSIAEQAATRENNAPESASSTVDEEKETSAYLEDDSVKLNAENDNPPNGPSQHTDNKLN